MSHLQSNARSSLSGPTHWIFSAWRTRGLAAFLFALFAATPLIYLGLRELPYRIALGGCSIPDYVNHQIRPECFERDWPSGISVWTHSWPIRIHRELASLLGTNGWAFLHIHIALEVLFFVFSARYLTATLFGNREVSLLGVVVLLCSHIAGIDLARYQIDGFGSNPIGLYYYFANGFVFLAFAFFLQDRLVPAFVSVAIVVLCNPGMGVFSMAFLAAYYCVHPSRLVTRPGLVGILLFLLISVPHLLNSSDLLRGEESGISTHQWLTATQVFSFHWYPSHMGMFGDGAVAEFFPTLLAVSGGFIALRFTNLRNEKHLKVLLGCVLSMLLAVFGIVVAEFFPIPGLVRLAPQRASGFVTTFAALYLTNYFCQHLRQPGIACRIAAIVCMVALCFSSYGFALLPMSLLLHRDLRAGRLGPLPLGRGAARVAAKVAGWCLFGAVACLMAVAMAASRTAGDSWGFTQRAKWAQQQLWPPLRCFDPFTSTDFSFGGLGAHGAWALLPMVTLALVILAEIWRRTATRRTQGVVFAIVLLLNGLALWFHIGEEQSFPAKEIASAYRDAQLWAREHTPEDALFLTDPTIYNGWRDYSERSSFGNLREWGCLAIGYCPSGEIYEEGRRRIAEFGVDIDAAVRRCRAKDLPLGLVFWEAHQQLKAQFEEIEPDRLLEICTRNRIDYVVLSSRLPGPRLAGMRRVFDVAFENGHFVVLRNRQATTMHGGLSEQSSVRPNGSREAICRQDWLPPWAQVVAASPRDTSSFSLACLDPFQTELRLDGRLDSGLPLTGPGSPGRTAWERYKESRVRKESVDE